MEFSELVKANQHLLSRALTIEMCIPEILSKLPDTIEELRKERCALSDVQQQTSIKISEFENKLQELNGRNDEISQNLRKEAERQIQMLNEQFDYRRLIMKHICAKIRHLIDSIEVKESAEIEYAVNDEELPEFLKNYKPFDARQFQIGQFPFEIPQSAVEACQNLDYRPLTVEQCQPSILSSLPDTFEELQKEYNNLADTQLKALMEIMGLEKKRDQLIGQSAETQLERNEAQHQIKILETKTHQISYRIKHVCAKIRHVLGCPSQAIKESAILGNEEPHRHK